MRWLLCALLGWASPAPAAAAENPDPIGGVFAALAGLSAVKLPHPAPPCPRASPRFTVDPEEAVWVGCEPKRLYNAGAKELFAVDRPYNDFLWLESGEFVISSGKEVGFPEPGSGGSGPDGAAPLVFRAAVSMSQLVRLFPGTGGGLFLAVKRSDATVELTWMEIGGGKGQGRLKTVGVTAGPIAAVAGDAKTAYFARGREIFRRTEAGEELWARHDSEDVDDLAYAPDGSLYFATTSGVGTLRGRTMFGLLKLSQPWIAIRGDSLFVLSARQEKAVRINGLSKLAELGERSLLEAGAQIRGAAPQGLQTPPASAAPPAAAPGLADYATATFRPAPSFSTAAPPSKTGSGKTALWAVVAALILGGIGSAAYSLKAKSKTGAGTPTVRARAPAPPAAAPDLSGTEDWPAEEFVKRFREAVEKGHFGRAQDLFSRVELILPLAQDPALYYDFALLAEKSDAGVAAARIYKRFIGADVDYRDVIDRYGALKKGVAPGAPPPSVPSEIGGQFEIREPIGEGGMGLVFMGFDKRLGRKVAIKKMRPEINADPKNREDFLQEARIISQLTHPYIVGIHAVLEHAGEIYLVFDFVDGKPLSTIIDQRKRIPLDECQRLFQQICEAIDCAHRARVLHRDLKPSNIMVDNNGFVKVMDFGLARQIKETVTRITIAGPEGTPAYMAPEQHLGRVSRASDIYSLGVCIYEALTGALPFPGPDFLAQKERMKFTPPQFLAPELPKETELLVSAALAANPKHRVADAMELFNLFKNCRLPG